MRRRVYWLGASVIIVAAAYALTVETWIALGVERRPWPGVVVLAGARFAVLLALLLFPRYRAKLRKWWLPMRQILRFTKWKPGATASLVLMSLCAFWWAWSYWRVDVLAVPVSKTRVVFLHSAYGVINVGQTFDSARVAEKAVVAVSDWFTVRPWRRWFRTGRGGSRRGSRIRSTWVFGLPHWVLVVPLAVLPFVAVAHGYKLYRRERGGLCPHCGYNLTGNTSGVCPECGAQVRAEQRFPTSDNAAILDRLFRTK